MCVNKQLLACQCHCSCLAFCHDVFVCRSTLWHGWGVWLGKATPLSGECTVPGIASSVKELTVGNYFSVASVLSTRTQMRERMQSSKNNPPCPVVCLAVQGEQPPPAPLTHRHPPGPALSLRRLLVEPHGLAGGKPPGDWPAHTRRHSVC